MNLFSVEFKLEVMFWVDCLKEGQEDMLNERQPRLLEAQLVEMHVHCRVALYEVTSISLVHCLKTHSIGFYSRLCFLEV